MADVHLIHNMKVYYYFGGLLFFGAFFLGSCQNGHHTEIDSIKDPIERLKAGNERFATFHPVHPDQTLQKLRELEKGQHPFAVIVSCSDSRVPPELVFDQGLGDLFVIRTAGNIIGDYELGSIEYAVEHLGVKLVVVMGHEECGAIKAFLESDDHPIGGHIKSIVEAIRKEPEEQKSLNENGKNVHEAVLANIHHGINQLRSSPPILSESTKTGKLIIKGAIYQIEDGRVRFLNY